MADQLNEVVKALSSIHKTANKSYFQFASYACNPKHFPKVVTAMIFSSTVIGFGVMEIVNRRREVCGKICHRLHVTFESRLMDQLL